MSDYEAILRELAAGQASRFNQSPVSQFLNAAGTEAGGKLGAAGQAIVQALMAPGNALQGKYDQVGVAGDGSVTMGDPRMYDDASTLAGLIGLSSMPMPRPTGSLGMGGRFTSAFDIEDFASSRGVSLSLSETPAGLRVNKIVVPPEMRGQGVGSDVMRAVTEYAQELKKPVALTPSTDFGGSMSGLQRFYKGLGFEPNKGRAKDYNFRETMILNPK